MKKIDNLNQNNIIYTMNTKSSMTNVPKKRGRKPKKRIESGEIPIINNKPKEKQAPSDNNTSSAIIMALPLSSLPDSFDANKCTKKDNISSSQQLAEKDIFHNDIPCDTVCKKCKHYEKMFETMERKLKMYENKHEEKVNKQVYNYDLNFISYDTNKKTTLTKTNIKCWWDGHSFDNLPCFLPEYYLNDTYYVRGCFCSFNCALAYNLYILHDNKLDQRNNLIYKLYKELFNIPVGEVVNIKVADGREILVDYGGQVTIEEFREKLNKLNEKYIMYIPPIRSLSITVELETKDKLKVYEDDYVLKKRRPKNSCAKNSLFPIIKK